MKLTYEAILKDPKLLDDTLAAARRQRATAFYELVVQPVKRWFAHAPAGSRMGNVQGRAVQG